MKKLMPYIFSVIALLSLSVIIPAPAAALTISAPTPPHITITIPPMPVLHLPTTIPSYQPTAESTQAPTPAPTRVVTITPKPTRTPSPTRHITKTPTPTTGLQRITLTKTPTPTLTPAETQSLLDDKQAYMLQAINDYRATYNLPKVTANKQTCDFATIRAKEIVTDFSHSGFINRANADALPYPTFQTATENIAETSDYKRVVTLWINSPGHAANMRADTPYVCVAYSGNYYAYEGWRP